MLSTLHYFVPSIQSCPNASWRIHSARSPHELPTRYFPITQDEHTHCRVSPALTLGQHGCQNFKRFNCLLRTGELRQLVVADIMVHDQLTFKAVNLPDTRETTHRHHRFNSIQMQHLPPPRHQGLSQLTRLSFVSLHALYRKAAKQYACTSSLTVLTGLLACFIQTEQPDNSTMELAQAVCGSFQQVDRGDYSEQLPSKSSGISGGW